MISCRRFVSCSINSSRFLDFFSSNSLAVGDLFFQAFEVLLFSSQVFLFLLGGILALLDAALLVADLGAGRFQFAGQLLAATKCVVASLQFGITENLFRFTARLIDKFLPADFG